MSSELVVRVWGFILPTRAPTVHQFHPLIIIPWFLFSFCIITSLLTSLGFHSVSRDLALTRTLSYVPFSWLHSHGKAHLGETQTISSCCAQAGECV